MDDLVKSLLGSKFRCCKRACRDAEIEDIEGGRKNYLTSVYYMDIVSELEKMGDFMINISQTLEKIFIRKY